MSPSIFEKYMNRFQRDNALLRFRAAQQKINEIKLRLGRTPLYQISNELDHHFRTRKNIKLEQFWLRTNEH